MKKSKNCGYCILLISLFGSSIISAYPSWVELGTYVIEDYQSWNSGSWNLPGGFTSAAAFWSAINDYCTHSTRSWRVKLEDYGVTDASLQNPVYHPNWDRELCDFLFIWPHAHAACLGNVHDADNLQEIGKVHLEYGNVRFGTMFNRWVFDNGCSTLLYYPNFWNGWTDAFKGLQVYFGMVSHGWPTTWVGEAMQQMIEEWTHPYNPHVMYAAYFDGMRNQVYQHGGISIEPGAMTSWNSQGDIFVFRTYEEATSEVGGDPIWNITMVFGTPIYD